MRLSSALAFASALTLTLQFLIFAYLYSFHRVRFFRYLVIAWGLMSLTNGFSARRAFVPHVEIVSGLLNATFFVATLLVLAGGLAFRLNYRIRARDVLVGAAGAIVAASFMDMSDSPVARSWAGLVTGTVLILAGIQFWPRGRVPVGWRADSEAAQPSPRCRGTRFLALSLALWGGHRIAVPFFQQEPGTGPHLMMHAAFMVFYFLCTFAIIIMVLERARAETGALKEFNERLVDGLGEGLQLVDGDYRVRHANRWMVEQFGAPRGRRCYEVLTADGRPCAGCPLPRRDAMGDAERLEVAGPAARRFSLSCSPVHQPDGQIHLLELVTDVTERERLHTRLTEAERLAAAGELAAGVAHEIRNPLAAIVNATTLLGAEETLTREERSHTLTTVKKEARRLNRILSDFLIFARPREPKLLRSDIREVLDHVGALIRDDPGRARVELDVRIDPAVPAFAF